MTEEALFERAAQLAAGERGAFLDRECPDPALRARVEALLAADAASNSPLDGPVESTRTLGDPAATGSYRPAASAEEAEGAVIAGRYKLRQRIGEGGMGTVWMADQTVPVKRRVAVKLIRTDRGNSRTILSRFEAERQAIALMDHPHIAKLLDAGTTDTGAPFFVMELVKGVPLSEFCDQHRLTIAERLALFTQICSAVQHAHQKGVIHRDLKPSNILVESHDGKPVPKVIDFGLAKATTGLQLIEHSLFTAFGSVMGTPLYMAPEQATFNAVDVDTRADVYALGVILYELLTGTTPLTKETLKKAALDEMLRLIREQEPPTPSSRLSSADSTPGVAASRQIEPAKLGRFVKGELDWIVLKALSKDRDRRYETASGFARDVERFLNHEPVTAGPPSRAYKFRKFVRRNRGQVIAASLVLLALVAGVAGTTIGMVLAERERHRAETAATAERDAKQVAETRRIEAERAADAERAATRQAEKRLAQIEKGVRLFAEMLDGLAPQGKTAPVLLAEIRRRAEKAAEQLDGEAVGDPGSVAQLQNYLGNSLLSLGSLTKAVEVLEKAADASKKAYGPDHPVSTACAANLANAYREVGRPDRAVPILEDVLKRLRATQGRHDPSSPNGEPSGGLGIDHLGLVVGLNSLALTYRDTGRLSDAVRILEEAHRYANAKLGPESRGTFGAALNLALVYQETGRATDAVSLLTRSLPIGERILGRGHPDVIKGAAILGQAHVASGRPDLALPILQEQHKIAAATLGPEHPDTVECLVSLGVVYWHFRRLDESVPLFERAVSIFEKQFGREHLRTKMAIANLGVNYLDAGRVVESIPHLEAAKDGANQHPNFHFVGFRLAEAYARSGRAADAARTLDEQLAPVRRQLLPGSPQLASYLALLGFQLNKLGSYVVAEPLLRESLAIREKIEPDAWSTFNTQSLLGGALLGQKKYADAEPLLLKGYEGMKAREKTIPPQGNTRIPEALDRLIELYTATGKPDEAKKYQELRAKYPAAKETLPPPPGEKK